MAPEGERRQDDKRIEVLQQSVTRIEAGVEAIKDARDYSQRMTDEFRLELKGVILRINERLDDLPCRERGVEIETIQTHQKTCSDTVHKRIDGVWAFIIVVTVLAFGSIGGVALGGGTWVGSIDTTVKRNTGILHELQRDFSDHRVSGKAVSDNASPERP